MKNILACGPSIPVAFVYGVLAAAGVVVSSFMWGLVSLFTGSIKLGLGLISFSAIAVLAFLAFIGFL